MNMLCIAFLTPYSILATDHNAITQIRSFVPDSGARWTPKGEPSSACHARRGLFLVKRGFCATNVGTATSAMGGVSINASGHTPVTTGAACGAPGAVASRPTVPTVNTAGHNAHTTTDFSCVVPNDTVASLVDVAGDAASHLLSINNRSAGSSNSTSNQPTTRASVGAYSGPTMTAQGEALRHLCEGLPDTQAILSMEDQLTYLSLCQPCVVFPQGSLPHASSSAGDANTSTTATSSEVHVSKMLETVVKGRPKTQSTYPEKAKAANRGIHVSGLSDHPCEAAATAMFRNNADVGVSIAHGTVILGEFERKLELPVRAQFRKACNCFSTRCQRVRSCDGVAVYALPPYSEKLDVSQGDVDPVILQYNRAANTFACSCRFKRQSHVTEGMARGRENTGDGPGQSLCWHERWAYMTKLSRPCDETADIRESCVLLRRPSNIDHTRTSWLFLTWPQNASTGGLVRLTEAGLICDIDLHNSKKKISVHDAVNGKQADFPMCSHKQCVIDYLHHHKDEMEEALQQPGTYDPGASDGLGIEYDPSTGKSTFVYSDVSSKHAQSANEREVERSSNDPLLKQCKRGRAKLFVRPKPPSQVPKPLLYDNYKNNTAEWQDFMRNSNGNTLTQVNRDVGRYEQYLSALEVFKHDEAERLRLYPREPSDASVCKCSGETQGYPDNEEFVVPDCVTSLVCFSGVASLRVMKRMCINRNEACTLRASGRDECIHRDTDESAVAHEVRDMP
jgi:hypothetical protein